MAVESLWGKKPKKSDIRTPKSILREQAKFVEEITNGVVIGEVGDIKRTTGRNILRNILRLRVPQLENYTYSLLRIDHPITFYPLDVFDFVNDEEFECVNEEDFLKDLKKILSSRGVMQVLSALITQAGEEIIE